MSDPQPGHIYDPSEPSHNPEGYKKFKAKKKKDMAQKMSKRFAKHANTFDRVHKEIKSDIKKRGGKPIF